MYIDKEKEIIQISDTDADELWPDAEGKSMRREYPFAAGRDLLYAAKNARLALVDLDPAADFDLGLNAEYHEAQRALSQRITILDGIIVPLEQAFGPLDVADEAERYLRSSPEARD